MRRILLTLPFLVGCLDKPGRPGGGDVDGGVDSVSTPDARPLPDAVYRQSIAVADINTDGYDDLVRWGNLSPGHDPRIWIYYGGDGGAFTGPSVELNPTFNNSRAWYEVLDVTIDDTDMDSPGVEIVAMVAEDRDVPDVNMNPQGRDIHVVTFNPAATEPLGRSSVLMDAPFGGTAAAGSPVFIVGRNTSATGREIVFGELNNHWRLTDTTGGLGTPIGVFLHDDGGANISDLQDMFDVDVAADEHLIGVTQGEAWSSDGPVAADAFEGHSGTLSSLARRRVRAMYDPSFMVAASEESSPFVRLVEDLGPSQAPSVAFVELDEVDDPAEFAIGNVGGTGLPDLLTLEDGELKVYRDLAINAGEAMPAMVFTPPIALDGYNMLAIGNFHAVGSGNEIYALGNGLLVPRCMVMTGPTQVEPCP